MRINRIGLINHKAVSVVSVIIQLIAFTALTIRSLMSVELTDEVYSIAAIYNASFGKRPFVDIWDPHTGWVLYVPLFRVFQVFSPSLEGIVLYFRLVYYFLAIVVLVACYLIVKRSNEFILFSFLPFAACIGYVAFSIPQMGHNSGVSYLMIFVFCLLCTIQSHRRFFLAGILMGLSCILYPTIVVLAILLLIPLFFVIEKNKLRLIAAYCGGVIVIGIIFFTWIMLGGNGFEGLITGIKATITTPHEINKGVIGGKFIQNTFTDRLNVFFTLQRSVIWGIHLVTFTLIMIFRKRERKGGVAHLLIEWMLFIVVATVEIFLCSDVQPISRGGYISFTIFASSFLLMLLMWKQTGYQVKILSLITISWILTYCFTSDNKNLFFAMDAAGTLVFFYASYSMLFYNTIGGSGKVHRNKYVNLGKKHPTIELSQIVFPTLLLVVGILCYFGYVYRDEPLGELKVRVGHGIYAGLYTTEENAYYVESLERDVESITAGHKNIFVANNMPAIYLMSKIEPFTPQTWDAQFLARGYTSAEPVLSYFEFKEKKPELVVMNNHLLSDLYDRNDAEIWAYLDHNYEEYAIINHKENDTTKIWLAKE